MSPGGRRPGNLDTRDDIIQAAKRVFAANGYEKASLRAVARDAGVDASLVHHYFDGKADLFVAAMSLPFDPRQVSANSNHATAGAPGARIVEGFLGMWDRAEGTGSSFAACAGAMASSPAVADAMREFVSERIWSVHASAGDEDPLTSQRRSSMIASQLMGLAFTRYILRVPPIATDTPAQIAQWAGPTVDRYRLDPLP
ncbi:MAG TPA: TetR family transcriptional regulator [Acidimicrobiales bacterium]|jgi:AcrR family transcriptional regulator|nr:TetR family transcriptional regulator [Acidimicrobiales bacterium]